MWKKNNEFFSVDGIPMPGGGAILIMNDISERIYAENALKENEEKYRVLTENSPAGILMIQNGSCVFANRMFGTITGHGQNISGKNFMDFVHTGDIKVVRKKMDEAIKGKSSSPCVIRLMRKDGKAAWVEFNACAINYDGVNSLLVNLIDVTGRKTVENKLKLSNKK
jgi:PAS domain S-box-containing protein